MGAVYPVALYELDRTCRGYRKGARVRADLVEGRSFFFKSLKGCMAFMAQHGMRHINEDEMQRLRAALQKTRRRK